MRKDKFDFLREVIIENADPPCPLTPGVLIYFLNEAERRYDNWKETLREFFDEECDCEKRSRK